MKFTLTFPQDTINQARQQVIESAAKTIKLKGFRQGKAPLDLVKDQLDPAKVTQTVLEKVFPQALTDHIQQNQLKPIADPVVHNLNTPDNADWEAEVEIAEKPAVILKDYKDAIKTLKAKDSIWTPVKGGPETEPTETDDAKRHSDQLNKILEALLEQATVEIPQILVDQDVNRQLANLVKQVGQLGLTVEDYLRAQNMTAEGLREAHAKEAERSYRLEYILQAVSQDMKIEVSDIELAAQVEKITDARTKHTIEHHAEEKEYYRALLVRQKTLEKLQAL